MKQLKFVSFGSLYLVWGLLFFLTAMLGGIFPAAEGLLRGVLMCLSVVFFLPPWMILRKARLEGSDEPRKLVRNLSLASLILSSVLLVGCVLSAGRSEKLGEFLHIVLVILSAPMFCSQIFALSLFLWAVLLIVSLKKQTRP